MVSLVGYDNFVFAIVKLLGYLVRQVMVHIVEEPRHPVTGGDEGVVGLEAEGDQGVG